MKKREGPVTLKIMLRLKYYMEEEFLLVKIFHICETHSQHLFFTSNFFPEN